MNPYQYLNSLKKYGEEGGFKPGLERVEALLAEFGHPENSLNVIHIAGTNGKGSTISFLKEIYGRTGYRVGIYTSPPLFKFNDRIMINNDCIDTDQLKELISEIDLAVNKIEKEVGTLSYFEVVTVLAFIYFYRQNVDLVLLEVGLGGRFDATNAVKEPLVSAITNISLEHTAILGDDIENISREKAGIVKYNRPVITAVQKDRALEVIKKVVRNKSTHLIQIDEKFQYSITKSSLQGLKIRVNSSFLSGELKIGLCGRFQVRNALLALGIIDELSNSFPVSKKDIFSGFKYTKWPGRLEIVKQDPLVIVDGAHNEAAMNRLSDFLDSHFSSGQQVHIIFGVLQDKNVKNMLQALRSGKYDFRLIITVNNNERALAPNKIKKIADKLGIENKVYFSLRQALKETISTTLSAEIICITGSLYTIKEAKNLLKTFNWLV